MFGLQIAGTGAVTLVLFQVLIQAMPKWQGSVSQIFAVLGWLASLVTVMVGLLMAIWS